MSRLELVLVDWSQPDFGPRLLGRLTDPDLVNEAQERLAASHVRQLRELRPPVRAVTPEDDGGDPP